MHMRTSQRSLSASVLFLGLINKDQVSLFSAFVFFYSGIVPCFVDTITWTAAMTDC